MSPELDKKLVAAFPLLYLDRNAPMTDTCMCWGFECDDVADAEAQSEVTCERCGNPGELRRNTGWHTTLCDEHNKRAA